MEEVSAASILFDPLFWSTLAQFLCAFVILTAAIYTWKSTRKALRYRIENINWKVQQVEQRLRMQEPNVHLIEQVAKKMHLSFDDVGGEKSKMLDVIWGDANSRRDVMPSQNHPNNEEIPLITKNIAST